MLPLPHMFILVIALGWLGCVGTESGNPFKSESSKFSLTLESSDSSQVSIDSGDGAITITEAWLWLKLLRYTHFGQCDMRGMLQVLRMGLAMDLIHPTPLNDIFGEEAQHLCRLGLAVETLTDSEIVPELAPPELTNHSLVVRGRTREGIEFIVKSPINHEFELLDSETGFYFDDNELLVFFDAAKWFSGISFSTLELSQGAILLDSDHNVDALEQFESNLSASPRAEQTTKSGTLLD